MLKARAARPEALLKAEPIGRSVLKGCEAGVLATTSVGARRVVEKGDKGGALLGGADDADGVARL